MYLFSNFNQGCVLLRFNYADDQSRKKLQVSSHEESSTGFLDELNIMWKLLAKSKPAMGVYAVWFLLLLGLELFILMNKRHEKPTDYDAMINHQMDTHIRKIKILSGNENTLVKLS